MRTLLIDNYDSFTFNLFHLLGEVNGDEPIVVRNDELSWEELAALAVDNIVISPGPGRPERGRDVGVSLDVLERAEVPVLGVCLGHQALAHMTGGAIDHAPEVMHGRLSPIHHDGRGLFAGIPQGFAAVRYHSLVVGAVPAGAARDGVDARPGRDGARAPHAAAVGRAVPPRVDLHRARAHAGAQLPRPDARATRRRARRGPPAGRRAGPRVRHRTLETWCDPEAAFVALYGDREHAVWLDSSRAEPGLARFSFMGAPDGPLGQVVRYDVATRALTIERAGGREELRESVLDYCERELARLRADAPELPFDFTCGFAGYLGYELKAELRRRARAPLAAARRRARVLRPADRLRPRPAPRPPARARRRDGRRRRRGMAGGDRARARRRSPPPAPLAPPAPGALRFAAREGRDAYLANIAACQHEIFEGETYEVCLTTELHSDGAIDPLAAYRALRARNPAPHAALLRLGDVSVLSSSPERFLRVDRERIVESKPIKGTAPRAAHPAEDAYRAAALRADDKSRAENLMIVDLVRNDLGRVCALGSVEVPALMAVESYATVHQLVTTVRGRLRDDASAIDCIRAAFPGGSMTGAPKLRTMEIIDRLEAGPRGVYSGALGFLSVNGTADLSIVIRTLVASPHGLQIGVGRRDRRRLGPGRRARRDAAEGARGARGGRRARARAPERHEPAAPDRERAAPSPANGSSDGFAAACPAREYDHGRVAKEGRAFRIPL